MVSWSLFFQRISDGLIICLCSSPAPTHLICCSFRLTSALYLAFKGLSLCSHNSSDVSLLTNCLSHTCTSMAMGPFQEASAVSCLIRTTCSQCGVVQAPTEPPPPNSSHASNVCYSICFATTANCTFNCLILFPNSHLLTRLTKDTERSIF